MLFINPTPDAVDLATYSFASGSAVSLKTKQNVPVEVTAPLAVLASAGTQSLSASFSVLLNGQFVAGLDVVGAALSAATADVMAAPNVGMYGLASVFWYRVKVGGSKDAILYGGAYDPFSTPTPPEPVAAPAGVYFSSVLGAIWDNRVPKTFTPNLPVPPTFVLVGPFPAVAAPAPVPVPAPAPAPTPAPAAALARYMPCGSSSEWCQGYCGLPSLQMATATPMAVLASADVRPAVLVFPNQQYGKFAVLDAAGNTLVPNIESIGRSVSVRTPPGATQVLGWAGRGCGCGPFCCKDHWTTVDIAGAKNYSRTESTGSLRREDKIIGGQRLAYFYNDCPNCDASTCWGCV